MRADAAYVDAVAAEVCFGEGEVWHLLYQVWPARGLGGGQLLLAQGGDRDRNALHVRTAEFGRGDRHGFHGCSYGSSLSQLHGRNFHLLRLLASQDHNGAVFSVGNQAATTQKAIERRIGRHLAFDATGSNSFHEVVRDQKLNSALRHIGPECAVHVASRNVEAGSKGRARHGRGTRRPQQCR